VIDSKFHLYIFNVYVYIISKCVEIRKGRILFKDMRSVRVCERERSACYVFYSANNINACLLRKDRQVSDRKMLMFERSCVDFISISKTHVSKLSFNTALEMIERKE